MAERKVLGPCEICGQPVYEDQDPTLEAERAAGDPDAPRGPAHLECVDEGTAELMRDWRRRIGYPPID